MRDLQTDVLDQIARAAAPLHPADHEPFINAAIALLKSEAVIGPGIVNRVVRGLLALGSYRRDVVTGAGRPKAGPHHGYGRAARRARHGKSVKGTGDAA
jgi:hypothetical protein